MASVTATPRRKRFRWRVLVGLLGLALVGLCVAGIFIGGQLFVQRGATPPTLVAQIVAVERRDLAETVQVNGALEPRDEAEVGFVAGARVREVLVAEGDLVQQGQPLARLETRDLELKVASAHAQLEQAEQALVKLQAGPTEAELAVAAAAVARARANIALAGQEVRPVDVTNARAQLELARQKLAELEEGVPPAELSSAEQQVLSAQDTLTASQVGLERTRDIASRSKQQAEQAMLDGAQAVEKAQRSYSDAFWDWDYVRQTGRHPTQKSVDPETGKEEQARLTEREQEAFRRTLDDATVALRQAESQLASLRIAYEDALEEEVRQVQEAERGLTANERAVAEARRALERQSTNGMATLLLAARKELADAEKAYRDLTASPDRAAKREELEASLLEAIAAQAKLSAGPDAADLAEARTKIEQARADLAQAEADLDDATLRAPIAGTVVQNKLQAGATVATGDVITIADLRGFLIRGTVTEQDVVSLTDGLTVEVTVDSVAGELFIGRLERVSDLPADQGQQNSDSFGAPTGAIGGLYPVEIAVATRDERLRVGMATTAGIQIFSLPRVLVVPLQAVQTDPEGISTVQKVTGPPGPEGAPPASETVRVELGRVSGDSVQILGGLSEGDELLLQQLPPPEGFPGVEVR